MTNLEFFLKTLGWQGGTIHQVSEELKKIRIASSLVSVNMLLEMNENAREVIKAMVNVKKS